MVLEILSGSSTIMAYLAEGQQRVRIAGTIGDRLPVNAAAGAKAILAFEPMEVIDDFLKGDLCRLTDRTITDRDTYKGELKKIHSRGYSLSEEEIYYGINAVGVPIFNHDGKAVAAVVVVSPVQRIDGEGDSDVVMKAKKTAAEISKRLHYKEQAWFSRQKPYGCGQHPARCMMDARDWRPGLPSHKTHTARKPTCTDPCTSEKT